MNDKESLSTYASLYKEKLKWYKATNMIRKAKKGNQNVKLL
jgi:hypothetical protein